MATTNQILKTMSKKLGRPLGSVESDDPPRLPTGIFSVDLALGGGIPMGRTSVIFGPEAALKTTLALKLVVSAQRLMPKRVAVFVDTEGHFSRKWAETLGVDTKKLVYLLPSMAEECVDMVEDLLFAEDVSLVVVDSLAALVTGRELEKSAEDALVGTQGTLINKFYRRTTHALVKARQEKACPTLLAINQIRFKIGERYGDPEIMPGGPSFRFLSYLTLRLWSKSVNDKKVHKTLPAYKEVHLQVKKWKVPVVAEKAEFLMALQPNPVEGLAVGDVPEVRTIMQYLRAAELVRKDRAGWVVDLGEEEASFKRETDLQVGLREDLEFRGRVKNRIISVVLEKGGVVAPDE